MGKAKKNPWLAGLLSLFLIGLGQIYNREYKKAIIFWIIQGVWLYALYMYASVSNPQPIEQYMNPLYEIVGLLIAFLPWLYSAYDAYVVARKTLKEEPNKKAALIIIVIFVSIILILIILEIISYWFVSYTSLQKQSDIQKYDEVRQRFLKKNEVFLNKIDEAFTSWKYEDSTTFRNKISELKTLLIELKTDYEFLCSFQENNRDLFPNITDSDIQKCKGFTKIYSECFPKYFDSLYSLSYLIDQAKQLKTEEDLNKYKNSCNSWLLDYNFIRGSCEALSKVYELNISLPDFSEVCRV